jgi:hypothetical protein
MAVIGPATGHYSSSSISSARRSQSRNPKPERLIDDPYALGGHRATYDPVVLAQRYGNDYQAEINRRVAIDSGDPTIAVLTDLRKQKLSGQPTGDYGIGSGYTSSTGGRGPIGSTGAITGSEYYDRMLEEQQRAIQERTDQAVAANNAYIPQINQRSDQALQNAYIAREQARVRAPQALNAMGYTGGPTETRLMGMEADYQNRRGTIEQDRQTALTGIQQNEAQIRSTGDATLSEAAQSYYNNLVTAAQRAEQQAQDQANWESEFALQEQQYSDAAAQQQWQNTYDEKLYELQRASAGKTSGVKTYGGYTFDQITDLVDRGLMSDETANSLLGLPGNTQPSGTGIRQTIGAVAVGVTPNRYTYRDVYNSIVPSRTPEGVRAAAQRLLAQGANPSYVEEALRSLGYQ